MSFDGDDSDANTRRGHYPAWVSPGTVRDIHVKLAVVSEKIDRLLEDRKTLGDHDDRLTSLELFAAETKTWAKVVGALFSIALAFIGAGLLWK